MNYNYRLFPSVPILLKGWEDKGEITTNNIPKGDAPKGDKQKVRSWIVCII
jgi:hypothetical protein